jgi:hypothetical protein
MVAMLVRDGDRGEPARVEAGAGEAAVQLAEREARLQQEDLPLVLEGEGVPLRPGAEDVEPGHLSRCPGRGGP